MVRHQRLHLAVVCAAAVVIRLCAAAIWTDALALDPDDYLRFARTLATSGVLGATPKQPSAYRPPGYPVILAGLIATSNEDWTRRYGILILHSACSVAIVIAVVEIARYAGAGPRSILAGWIVAMDPLMVRQATLIMSETLFAALICLLLVIWFRNLPGE